MTIDRSSGPAGSLTWTLSIDFGTSSTVIVASTPDGQVEVIEVEGERRIPSVLLLDDDNASWIIGRTAIDLAPSHPSRVVRAPKRRLGDQTPLIVAGQAFRSVAIVAEILRFAAEAATQSMGSDPGAVRMTFPATWNNPLQARLAEAAALAGLPEPTFIAEPVAAAFSLPRQPLAGANVAVYDLGGGTFDTTIVRSTEHGYEVIGRPTGDPAIGGELFDELLLNHVGEQLDQEIWDNVQVSPDPEWAQTRMRLLNACRRAKEALTTTSYADVAVGHPTGLIEQRVTRAELDGLVVSYIDESIELVARAISQANLTPADLEAIHLIGGASRMPIIRERVGSAFEGVPIHQLGDPRTAVAIGAARSVLARTQTATPPAAPTRPGQTQAPTPPLPTGEPAAPSGAVVQPASGSDQPPVPNQPATPNQSATPNQPAMPPAAHQRTPTTRPPVNQIAGAAAPQTPSKTSDSRVPILAAAGVGAVLLLGVLFFALRPDNQTAATEPTVTTQTTLPTTAPTTTEPTIAPTTAPTTTAPTTTAPTTTAPPSSQPPASVAAPDETVAPDGGPTALAIERALIDLNDLPPDEGWTLIDEVEYSAFTLCDTPAPTPPVYIDGVAFEKGEGEGVDRIVSRSFVYATEEDAAAAMERDRLLFESCPGGALEIDGESFLARFITPDGEPVTGVGDEVLIWGVVYSLDGGLEVSFNLSTTIRHGRTISETSYEAIEPIDEPRNELLLELSIGQFLSVIGLER